MKNPIESVELDLTLGNGHEHPDIDTESYYLCKISGAWFTGKFRRQWFGLQFTGWVNPVGLQYDKPGTNASNWKRVIKLTNIK